MVVLYNDLRATECLPILLKIGVGLSMLHILEVDVFSNTLAYCLACMVTMSVSVVVSCNMSMIAAN
jgi:hypothetical protein